MAFQALFERDRAGAERFLLAECDLEKTSSACPEFVIKNLTNLGTDEAKTRLQQLSTRIDDIGQHARGRSRTGAVDAQPRRCRELITSISPEFVKVILSRTFSKNSARRRDTSVSITDGDGDE
jgi:hypothetical protein